MSIAGMPHPMLSAPHMAGMPHMGAILHQKTGFSGGIHGFDAGGATGVGGAPENLGDQNPQMQGVIQRYSSLPTEKLQELSQRMQGTPYAGLIQKILQQKQTQPQMAPAAPTAAPMAGGIAGVQAATSLPQARGGATERRANGGISMSADDPTWTRAAANEITSGGSGFLAGSTMGRADAINTTAPAGAYILPADVVAGLGEGNSLAGARAVDEMLRTGPWGTANTPARRGSGPPRPPSIRQEDSKGGGIKGNSTTQRVPVLLSHGEYEIHPQHVVAIGRHYLMEHAKKTGRKGVLFSAQQCLKAGHKILDAFVIQQRKEHISKLKKLPGPVRTAA